ncbi:hypothetical protein FRB94_013573 [Tulasnella sp. JGI-2019a]|nr:hypothetical protein FRB93_005083 [Tulasnella sp. JGI-2019a]KAG9014263.1 hypothetical protein FRB94_013573 [Tulasnella sp. JGI-2019a]KAG9023334.1 hypothetical protein FRB95_013251 [Tulasnella sp. JGI-2019a]
MGCVPSRSTVQLMDEKEAGALGKGSPMPNPRRSLPPWVTRQHDVFDPACISQTPETNMSAIQKDSVSSCPPKDDPLQPPSLRRSVTLSSDPFAVQRQ